MSTADQAKGAPSRCGCRSKIILLGTATNLSERCQREAG
jgi:hypothetical protein